MTKTSPLRLILALLLLLWGQGWAKPFEHIRCDGKTWQEYYQGTEMMCCRCDDGDCCEEVPDKPACPEWLEVPGQAIVRWTEVAAVSQVGKELETIAIYLMNKGTIYLQGNKTMYNVIAHQHRAWVQCQGRE